MMLMTILQRETNQAFETLPWWVRAMAIVGVPSVIASGLTWMLATGIATDLRETRRLMELGIARQAAATDALAGHIRQTDINGRYLEALCFNLALTASEKTRCTLAGR